MLCGAVYEKPGLQILTTPDGTVVCLPAWLLGLLAVLLAGGGALREYWRRRQGGSDGS